MSIPFPTLFYSFFSHLPLLTKLRKLCWRHTSFVMIFDRALYTNRKYNGMEERTDCIKQILPQTISVWASILPTFSTLCPTLVSKGLKLWIPTHQHAQVSKQKRHYHTIEHNNKSLNISFAHPNTRYLALPTQNTGKCFIGLTHLKLWAHPHQATQFVCK